MGEEENVLRNHKYIKYRGLITYATERQVLVTEELLWGSVLGQSCGRRV